MKFVYFSEVLLEIWCHKIDIMAILCHVDGQGKQAGQCGLEYFLHIGRVIRIEEPNIVKVHVIFIDCCNNCLRYSFVIGVAKKVSI